MTLQETFKLIETIKKGAFTKISQRTTKKPLAKYKDSTIEKYTDLVVRMGISFQNMKQNQNRITGPLPWGQWMAGYENYLIEHNGKVYLRLYTDDIHSVKSVWYLNGKETTKQYLEENKIIGKKSSKDSHCYNILIDNIISIGV